MDASQTSDFILSFIRKSNLNFSLTEFPFYVSIMLKKSFIKNKDGSSRSPTLENNSNNFEDSQQVLKNSHQHGILLPQNGDIHEQDPVSAQVPP